MAKIVAIGGGEIGRPGHPVETTAIDREIKKMSGKSKPKLCFLPTASHDAQGYVAAVRKHFGRRIGCDVSVLCLIGEKHSYRELQDGILSSDIVYVGGGDTQLLLDEWRKAKLDVILAEAFHRGIVLSGLSAGAMCWFAGGCSDMLKSAEAPSPLVFLPCLNFIGLAICPHYRSDDEHRPAFKDILRMTKTVGVGLDDCAALKINGDTFKIITAQAKASAWLCAWRSGRFEEKRLPVGLVRDLAEVLNPPAE